MDDTQQNIIRKEIIFSNERRAFMLITSSDVDAEQIVQALNIQQPKAIIVIIGGAKYMRLNDQEQAYLSKLFSLGIAHAAVALDASIVSGGANTGVMKMIGQGVADCGHRTVLLGVSPGAKMAYPGGPAEGSIEGGSVLDPNYSHFVLVKGGGWGNETTKTLYRVVKALSQDIPVVVIVAGGGPICKQEVLQTVHHGWPIIIIEGSTGEADRIASLWSRKASFLENISLIADSVDAEILAQGKVQIFPITGVPEALEQLIFHQCQK